MLWTLFAYRNMAERVFSLCLAEWIWSNTFQALNCSITLALLLLSATSNRTYFSFTHILVLILSDKMKWVHVFTVSMKDMQLLIQQLIKNPFPDLKEHQHQ